jgi:purine-nucleoside phosphorylase
MTEADRIAAAAAHVRAQRPDHAPRVGVVLGSGLGAIADRLEDVSRLPYDTIPGFHGSAVEGHAGQLCLGQLAGVPAAIMQGRIHLYEGHPVEDVVRPVRMLVAFGCRTLVITNAAGGIDSDYVVGDLMVIRDHLNLTGRNPLVGPNDASLGPRFPDMSDAYARDLRDLAHLVAKEQGHELRQGVYAGLLGPSYETPAEIRMLRAIGADAVGMSTVLETIAARHMGARVLGISCISNAAAGMSGSPLDHAEVKAAADMAQGRLADVISAVVARLPA